MTKQIRKVTDPQESREISNGSAYAHICLVGCRFRTLQDLIGPPSVVGSSDDKVQVEWIFDLGKDKCLTIYDWKEYYKSINLVDGWHIGKKGITPEEAREILKELFPNDAVEIRLDYDV